MPIFDESLLLTWISLCHRNPRTLTLNGTLEQYEESLYKTRPYHQDGISRRTDYFNKQTYLQRIPPGSSDFCFLKVSALLILDVHICTCQILISCCIINHMHRICHLQDDSHQQQTNNKQNNPKTHIKLHNTTATLISDQERSHLFCSETPMVANH